MATKPIAGRPKDPEKSRKILEAAGQLFKDQGFAATSMDAIAQQARVSKQTLYSHFAGKDDLFKQVIKSKVDFYQFGDLENQLTWDLRQDLCLMGRFLLGLILDEEAVGMMATVIGESRKSPKVAELFYEMGPGRVNTAIETYLQSQVQRGEIQITAPHDRAILFMNMLKGEWHMQALMNACPEIDDNTLDRHIRQTVEQFLVIIGVSNQT